MSSVRLIPLSLGELLEHAVSYYRRHFLLFFGIMALRVEDALQESLGTAEPRVAVTSLPDERKGEKLVVLHTELGHHVEELLKRLRDINLPKLWVPRKENFFEIAALPILAAASWT